MPRRRRGSAVAAIEAETERGLMMRILLHSPKDLVAGALAFAAVSAIIANALFLQAGRHPSPMFGSAVTLPAAALTPASPLPRPRPVEAARTMDALPAERGMAEPKVETRPADPMTNLVKATTAAPVTHSNAAPSNIMRPPAPIPAASRDAGPASASRRVASVQRALTEYGYGQLKPTGTIGSDTQAAIQKFERERKIPVTGQMSDRLVKELAAVTGKPID
jgi:hypothetical protein